jgi:hypothetical protein
MSCCCQSPLWCCTSTATTNREKAGRCSARNRVACTGEKKRVAAVVVFMHGITSRTRNTMKAENSNDRGVFALPLADETALV